jgi:hypothetical protein
MEIFRRRHRLRGTGNAGGRAVDAKQRRHRSLGPPRELPYKFADDQGTAILPLNVGYYGLGLPRAAQLPQSHGGQVSATRIRPGLPADLPGAGPRLRQRARAKVREGLGSVDEGLGQIG